MLLSPLPGGLVGGVAKSSKLACSGQYLPAALPLQQNFFACTGNYCEGLSCARTLTRLTSNRQSERRSKSLILQALGKQAATKAGGKGLWGESQLFESQNHAT